MLDCIDAGRRLLYRYRLGTKVARIYACMVPNENDMDSISIVVISL